MSTPEIGITSEDKAIIEAFTGRESINANTIRSVINEASDRAPEGACASCGVGLGHYSGEDEVVTCFKCGLPWPSSYWEEQA